MSKHIVFLLHGMGQHYNANGKSKEGSVGWSDAGVKSLKSGASKIGYSGNVNNDYEFVPISYSDIFDKYLEEYKVQSERLLNNPSRSLIKSVSAQYPLLGAIMKLAKAKPNTKSFMVTHFGDVLLYATTNFQRYIREHVRNEILKGIETHGVGNEWSLLTHSLGTTVGHEFLQSLFSKTGNYSIYGKPTAFITLGNVTELMYKGKTSTFYKNTRVFPSRMKKEGACRQYINACHPLDPFTWLRHFDPPAYWGNGQTDDRYHEPAIRSSHITHWNTHDFDHYLSHPRVQELFFSATHEFSPSYWIDPQKVSKRMTKYEEESVVGGFQKLREEVEKIKVTQFNNWDELAVALVDYNKILKAFNA